MPRSCAPHPVLDEEVSDEQVSDEEAVDIVVACCRDEADIIEGFIDFYIAQGFDRICLVDNGSVDGTTERILGHPEQDRILLLRDARRGYDMRLLEYYRMFAVSAVRWVFFLDVDEFVTLPGGIKAYAESLPPEVTLHWLPTAEMQPPSDALPARSPLCATRREAAFQQEPKVVWRAVDVRKIFCGKHDVQLEPRVEHRDERVFIRHFHSRSEAQFRRKLQNRIETDEAMGRRADRLTLFSPDARESWIARSKRLLAADGWSLETRRLASLDTVEDHAVAEWCARKSAIGNGREVSPVISLDEHSGWLCFCRRDFRRTEGHTGTEHLVLLYEPERAGDRLDGRAFESAAAKSDAAVPVRIHSECLMGDAFASGRCDCGYQLAAAMTEIESAGGGVIIYLRQEGRGVGLFEKIRSLAVDHDDTFHRNELAGLPDDSRAYAMAAEILRDLGIRKVRLLSGNPNKAAALCAAGIAPLLDQLLPFEQLTEEARSEIRAKLKRGYRYRLGDRDGVPLRAFIPREGGPERSDGG